MPRRQRRYGQEPDKLARTGAHRQAAAVTKTAHLTQAAECNSCTTKETTTVP